MTGSFLRALRSSGPYIHCISNVVSANDVANLLLAVGARPILAQAPEEAGEVAANCAACVLNCGTPDEARFAALHAAALGAQKVGRPVVLDPVGVTASAWRGAHIRTLLGSIQPTILHGNWSEIGALLGDAAGFHGVDSADASEPARREAAQAAARHFGCVVVLSGPDDVIADETRIAVATGGCAEMRAVTGTGCMLSALLGAFAAVSSDPFEAAHAACVFWKTCAADAWKHTRALDGGPGLLHTMLFDAAARQSADAAAQ